MRSVAVYCSSSNSIAPIYKEAATLLGETLAAQQISLVYGGSTNGLMGAVADAVLTNGGTAIGIIPHVLGQHEIAHRQLTELIEVDTMHERKKMMMDRAEGFIVLPGGAGTMEEFFEVFTWAQIGLNSYPIGLLNCNGYYDPLIAFLQKMTEEQFMQPQFLQALIIEQQIDLLITKMQVYEQPVQKTF